MNKELLAGLSSILFPVSLYALPTSGGAYQRNYQRTYQRAAANAQRSLPRSGYTLSVKPPRQFIQAESQLDLLVGRAFTELLIIDAAVPEKYLLKRELKPGVDVVELNGKQDGLKQLESILARYHALDAVHIVSHAEDGRVQLGDSWLDTNIIKNRVEFFSSINNAIKDGGDLLFYGCDLAAGEQGEEFLDIIAYNTHVDIAASDDLTGHTTQNGDWNLEIQRGHIDRDKPFSEAALKDFHSILAINDGTGRTITTSGFPGGYGNTKSYDVDATGYVLRLSTSSASNNAIYCGFGYCSVNFGGGLTDTEQLYIEFTDGSSFDIDSLQAYSPAGNNTYVFTPTPGSAVNGSGFDGGFTTQNLNFTNITRLTITRQDNGDLNGFDIDNLVMSNASPANASPTISIDNAALAYTENGTAIQIDSAGTVSDADGDADWNGGTLEVQTTLNAEGTDTNGTDLSAKYLKGLDLKWGW